MGIPPPWKMLYFRWPKCTLQYPPLPIALECQWGLICIPHVYHSFHRCWTVYSQWHLITETDHQPKVESVATSVLDLSIKFFKGRTSISGNSSSSQSWNSFSFRSPPVGKCPWRTDIHQQQLIIIAKFKNFLLPFSTCPSIYLKDSHLFAATDHHLKVEILSPSVLDLSINLLKGLTFINSNRSSSESTNSVLFRSGSIPPFPWRTSISFQQDIMNTIQTRNFYYFWC